MKLFAYLKDQLFLMLGSLLMLALVFLLLSLYQVTISLKIAIMLVLIIFIFIGFGYSYLRKYYFYQDFITKLERLDKKCLITELAKRPEFLEGKIMYDSLYEIDKSMYEEIEVYQDQLKDFKEYIELWVHEIKIPIASAKLMLYNRESNLRKLKNQLNRIENNVEMVLYYARLESSESDYLIKKCNLDNIIKNVIKKNQDSLLYQKIAVELSDINYQILSDSKWLEFIINQVVSNSIKYHHQDNCRISFNAYQDNHSIALEIIDNGIGIKAEDLEYVFDKSFTGSNGRAVSSATGMGLYIVKSLCNKLGHHIKIESQYQKYTKVTLYFNDDQYFNVVR